ncbi:hypothetical protein B0H10DRAFT_1092325 [Mycena sp. CBHHK59/15]|nr:hypothetical protein B0H10DRAFT_1092325 [Mycena sp. CBHHK59/15]
MAHSSVWMTLVSMLATFDIKKAVGEDGQIIEPTYEYSAGMVVCVLRFCSCRMATYSPLVSRVRSSVPSRLDPARLWSSLTPLPMPDNDKRQVSGVSFSRYLRFWCQIFNFGSGARGQYWVGFKDLIYTMIYSLSAHIAVQIISPEARDRRFSILRFMSL